MAEQVGSGFKGTSSAQVSTANIEIADFTGLKDIKAYYKFQFKNTQACSVKINGSTIAIYLAAGQGFQSDVWDAKIRSFIIVEAAISYSFVGYY